MHHRVGEAQQAGRTLRQGQHFTIHLKGVGWTETEQIYHVVYDNAFAGYACAFQSSGDLTIFLTASGAPGWHYIDMYPGIYQGTETRPANYKMPQLTSDADHPGEPLDKDIYDLGPEELAKVPSMPGSLEDALDALERDHQFLLKGDVFTKDFIANWCELKRKEYDALRLRPHPYEFAMYYDV